jgi:hypothetical protein
MIYVHGGDAVAQAAEDVPETGRVGSAGDEARDLATVRDQLMAPNRGLDALG